MKRDAFSLIEMLVATALSAVLMAAVLVIVAGVSRDRRRLSAAEARPRPQSMIDRIQWDLTNAMTIRQSPDGHEIVLIGHGAIDPETLEPNGRLAQVSYRCYRQGVTGYLVREQQYLDDAVRRQAWRDVVEGGVASLQVFPVTAEPVTTGSDANGGDGMSPLPRRVRLRIDAASGIVDRELWTR